MKHQHIYPIQNTFFSVNSYPLVLILFLNNAVYTNSKFIYFKKPLPPKAKIKRFTVCDTVYNISPILSQKD